MSDLSLNWSDLSFCSAANDGKSTECYTPVKENHFGLRFTVENESVLRERESADPIYVHQRARRILQRLDRGERKLHRLI